MAGIIYIPAGNSANDLTGAVLDSDAGPGTTSTGLANGTQYRAYSLSVPSELFLVAGVLTADNGFATADTGTITADQG